MKAPVSHHTPAGRNGPILPGLTVLLLCAVLTACSSGSTDGTGHSGSGATDVATTVTSTGTIDLSAIPLGDGYLSTTPKVGYVDSCVTSFGTGLGGAVEAVPWIDYTTKTWDSRAKPTVSGAVSWPNATFSVTASDGRRIIVGNDLPIDHTTGIFPISTTDSAYDYDHNPNSITPQPISWSLPLAPPAATTPQCLGLGPIGVLSDGVYLYDALDGEGRDAGAHEVLDSCGEHPNSIPELHHHEVPSCILATAKGRSTLVGYAADGYGIYVERSADGALLTNRDLDACHGRTSPVLWNGRVQDVYHYDATLEYPYTLGCYHGTPTSTPG